MATQDKTDDTVDTSNENEEVETSNEEDEVLDQVDDTESEETEDSDEEESEEDAEAETEEEDEEFEKRFIQFKGNSYEEYTPQLEKVYGEALAEMTRMKQANKDSQAQIDSIRTMVAKDPAFAKKLDDLMGGQSEQVVTDPALLEARQNMEERMDKEYKDFVDAHPEMESNPQLAEEVLAVLSDFGQQSRKQGKIMGMKDALNKAWAYLGKEDSKEKVVIKAKEVAAKSKTGNSVKKKTATKQEFTDEQVSVAKKWGLTPEQLIASAKSS